MAAQFSKPQVTIDLEEYKYLKEQEAKILNPEGEASYAKEMLAFVFNYLLQVSESRLREVLMKARVTFNFRVTIATQELGISTGTIQAKDISFTKQE